MCAATGEAGSHNADIVEALSSWRTRAARATIILVLVIVVVIRDKYIKANHKMQIDKALSQVS